jgi:uncharacterized protein (TIGR00369 family)
MPDATSTPPVTLHRRTVNWANPEDLAKARRATTGRDFFEQVAQGQVPPPPLYDAVGIRLTEVGTGASAIECLPGEHLYNPANIVHGGLHGILIDSAAGVALQSTLPEGPRPGTVRLSVDFLRPITAETGLIRCEGRLVKGGRQIGLSDADIVDGEGKLLARGQVTFALSPTTAWSHSEDAVAPANIDPAWRSHEITWADPAPLKHLAIELSGLDFAERIAAGDIPQAPFAATVGFFLSHAAPGSVTFSCQPSTMHYNPMGSAHGGLAFSLIDSATGISTATTLEPGEFFTTVNTTVEFYRPITVESGMVFCQGEMIRNGRRVKVADASITDEAGTVYGRGQSTCLVVQP